MSEKKLRDLSDSISKVPYVGKSREKAFKRLGILTVEDLLLFIPRQAVDFSHPDKIKNLKLDDKKPIYAKISQVKLSRTYRKKLSITRALLSDDSGSIEAIWFNQPYLGWALKKGERYLFYGEVKYDKYTGKRIYSNPEFYKKVGIFPIYSQTKDLSSKQISRTVESAISAGFRFHEYLPSKILKKYNLDDINKSISNLHFPRSVKAFQKAKSRIIINKLVELMLANFLIKQQNKTQKSIAVNVSKYKDKIDRFIKSLPFTLTSDQQNVIDEITSDIAKEIPMNRVIQGDVGSGKTIVAVVASLPIIWSGYKAVWLAPTQVLAIQHYKNIKKLLGRIFKIALVTAGSKTGNIKNSNLIIGTHALLEEKINIDRLGLVIVDEQHRFGVKQREKLKSKNQNIMPHFLSLTATPIPRTLSHIIFGNCDVSTIRSKPAGRKKIKTFIIPEYKRRSSYEFIDKLISNGQKAYIICPAIGMELDTESDRKAVMVEADKIKKTAIGKRKIAILHSQMKPKDKEKSFKEFAFGKAQVLVSTSVIEVGVDVPLATMMIIEDAHNFGLAQLHQFRGRIGRSNLQSYCFCFSNNLDNTLSRERLRVFVQHDNGFKLAEYDLKLRGPGTLIGLEQSGFVGINPIWFENTNVINSAKEIANEIDRYYQTDKYLYNKINSMLKTKHLE